MEIGREIERGRDEDRRAEECLQMNVAIKQCKGRKSTNSREAKTEMDQ
jgi:hypothetical protein